MASRRRARCPSREKRPDPKSLPEALNPGSGEMLLGLRDQGFWVYPETFEALRAQGTVLLEKFHPAPKAPLGSEVCAPKLRCPAPDDPELSGLHP